MNSADRDPALIAWTGEPGTWASVWVSDRAVHNYFSYRYGYVKRYMVAPIDDSDYPLGHDTLGAALTEFKKRTGL